MCTTAIGREHRRVWPLLVTVIWCLASTAWSEPKPPKFLPRVIAGFYSFHPSYDTDIPAEIKTTKNKPNVVKQAASHQTRYFKQYQHQFSSAHHQYKHQYRYPGDYREKFHGSKKKLKSNQSPFSSFNKHYSHPTYQKNHYFPSTSWVSHAPTPHWEVMSHFLKSYITLAQKLAIFYGTKYNYPINTLYVSSGT